jgi:hypothetical protein
MGAELFKTNAKREALAFVCDSPTHADGARTAWFDCGSRSGNVSLAKAAGWTEGFGIPDTWLCPQCMRENARKQKARRKGGIEFRCQLISPAAVTRSCPPAAAMERARSDNPNANTRASASTFIRADGGAPGANVDGGIKTVTSLMGNGYLWKRGSSYDRS